MKSKRILVWFRNDLRLHDNEMLVEAIAKSDSILPVYFFDERHFESTRFETLKTGINRAHFLLQSVSALRSALQLLGGDILIVHGRPEDAILKLVMQFDISEVYHHREVGPEETLISTDVEDVLWQQKINLRHFIGHTLYNKEDLPFPIKDIPDVFTQFKKKTERDAVVKSCFETPQHIEFVENEHWGELPTITTLGFSSNSDVITDAFSFGGEAAGLRQLKMLVEIGSDVYLKPTKSTVEKPGFSSRLSAWLGLGCLSPRKVYWMIKDAESKLGSNPNFNHILLGLLWRDYYRFMFKKHGVKFFDEPGLLELISDPVMVDDPMLVKWKNGNTGHSVVDKYMHELNASGFIHHSGRLLVATFLVHVLKIHWTKGAVYFEEKLIDYAPASNWGNWANIAGAGLDHKSKNIFDLEKQLKVLEIADANSLLSFT